MPRREPTRSPPLRRAFRVFGPATGASSPRRGPVSPGKYKRSVPLPQRPFRGAACGTASPGKCLPLPLRPGRSPAAADIPGKSPRSLRLSRLLSAAHCGQALKTAVRLRIRLHKNRLLPGYFGRGFSLSPPLPGIRMPPINAPLRCPPRLLTASLDSSERSPTAQAKHRRTTRRREHKKSSLSPSLYEFAPARAAPQRLAELRKIMTPPQRAKNPGHKEVPARNSARGLFIEVRRKSGRYAAAASFLLCSMLRSSRNTSSSATPTRRQSQGFVLTKPATR